MKAKPIIYEGIQFRSKLEARWYIFMKKLGWNIIYEPEIEGLNGWIPDYLIIGKQHKILVDVKPIDKAEEWKAGYHDFEKNKYIITKKHKDYDKIMNSGIKKLHDYELLILGTNLQLDENESMGIFYIRDTKLVQKKNKEKIICPSMSEHSESYYNWKTKKLEDKEGNELIELPNNNLYEDGNCIFSHYGDQIGFMTHMMGWCCRITGEHGKTYIFRDNQTDLFKEIDTYWNEAWTELRWKGKE